MASKSRLAFIAAFVAICWITWAALVGIFTALAHFLGSTTAAVTTFLAVFYSCLFGLVGWQVHTWKGRRDGWPSANRCERRSARPTTTREKQDNDPEAAESGWKRS
ncbi:MAG: hypothetical protein ACJ746_04685 [Bryobacteraceae bacterium]